MQYFYFYLPGYLYFYLSTKLQYFLHHCTRLRFEYKNNNKVHETKVHLYSQQLSNFLQICNVWTICCHLGDIQAQVSVLYIKNVFSGVGLHIRTVKTQNNSAITTVVSDINVNIIRGAVIFTHILHGLTVLRTNK